MWVKVYCVLDSDYHPPSEVEKRLKEAQQRGVELHIWSRKEIENYLLVPSVVNRVIHDLKKSNGQGPTENEIEECLSRLADGLRDETLDALAAEVHLSDRVSGVARANRLARERVEQAWQSIEGKLGIVSGKQLLSGLSSWSQATYGVSLSIGRLAASFLPADVPPEVVQVVGAIEEGRAFGAEEMTTSRNRGRWGPA